MKYLIEDLSDFTQIIAHIEDAIVRRQLMHVRSIIFARLYAALPSLEAHPFYDRYHMGVTIAEVKSVTDKEEMAKVKLDRESYQILHLFIDRRYAFGKFVRERCIDVVCADEDEEEDAEECILHLDPATSPYHLKYLGGTHNISPVLPTPSFPHTKGPSICEFRPLPTRTASASSDRTSIFACSALPGHPAKLWTYSGDRWNDVDIQIPANKQYGEDDDRAILSVSHHGSLLLTSVNDGKVYLWEKRAQGTQHTVRRRYEIVPASKSVQKKNLPVWSTSFARYGYLFAAGSADGTVGIWNTETATAVWMLHAVGQTPEGGLAMGSDIASLAWHPTGQYIFAAPQRRECLMWDIAERSTGKPVRTLPGCPNQIVSMSADPKGGKYLLGGSCDGTLYIWDIQAERLLKKWSDEMYSPIYSIAWSDCGSTILLAKGKSIYYFTRSGLIGADRIEPTRIFRGTSSPSHLSFIQGTKVCMSIS